MIDGLSTGEDGRIGGWHALHRAKGVAATVSRGVQDSGDRRPLLLVSVRSTDEALAALAGGADVIDVKEPLRGPLGMADADVIADIVACVAGRAPVSAALGEVQDTSAAGRINSRAPELSRGLTFAKFGFAGSAARADWIADWLAVRAAFETAAGRALPWIAVAYADAGAAASPPIDEIINTAARTGCRGVLIDTFDKSSGGIFDVLSVRSLRSLGALARTHKLSFAVAGRLRPVDLRRRSLRTVDVVGVRSAACAGGDRTQKIVATQVALLRNHLKDHLHLARSSTAR